MMNRKNLQILKIIQNNGRISNAEIARQVGLTPSAILERLRKLEDQGVITDYIAKIDKRKLGFSITAFILVRSDDLSGGTEMPLAEIPEVLEVHDIVGEYSYLVKACARDSDDLKRLVRREIGTLPNVTATNTILVLETTKETSVLPIKIDEAEKKKKGNKK